MATEALQAVDQQVAELIQMAVSALNDIERHLADLRLNPRPEWTPSLRQSLERLNLAFSGVMDLVQDPRFPVSLDIASAQQFSVTVNGLQGYFTSYPNDAPNIVPGAWQQVSNLGSILRGAFLGSVRGGSSAELVVADRAVGRLQQVGLDLRAAEKALEDVGVRHASLVQDVSAFMGTMNNQLLERQTLLEREWREALRVERDAVTAERDALRADVDKLREENRALHASFSNQAVAAIKSLEAARDGTVERLADYERQAREALGAVGSTAQSAPYQATAEAASSRANWWQGGAVAGMVGTGASLLVFIF